MMSWLCNLVFITFIGGLMLLRWQWPKNHEHDLSVSRRWPMQIISTQVLLGVSRDTRNRITNPANRHLPQTEGEVWRRSIAEGRDRRGGSGEIRGSTVADWLIGCSKHANERKELKVREESKNNPRSAGSGRLDWLCVLWLPFRFN